MLLIAPLAGCAHTAILTDAADCSALIPKGWRTAVPPADLPLSAKLPDGHDDARPWQNGFVQQTGQLEKANDRTGDTIEIVSECERQRRAAVQAAKRKPFLGLF